MESTAHIADSVKQTLLNGGFNNADVKNITKDCSSVSVYLSIWCPGHTREDIIKITWVFDQSDCDITTCTKSYDYDNNMAKHTNIQMDIKGTCCKKYGPFLYESFQKNMYSKKPIPQSCYDCTILATNYAEPFIATYYETMQQKKLISKVPTYRRVFFKNYSMFMRQKICASSELERCIWKNAGYEFLDVMQSYIEEGVITDKRVGCKDDISKFLYKLKKTVDVITTSNNPIYYFAKWSGSTKKNIKHAWDEMAEIVDKILRETFPVEWNSFFNACDEFD